MKVGIMKERDKGFMCLIQVMICDKELGVTNSRQDIPDVTLQKGKKNHKFTFMSEEINAWNIDKLTIVCSETTFSKNSYYFFKK